MWKRLQNARGAPQQPTGMSIGSPVLKETTLDQRDYPGLQLPLSTSPPDRYTHPLQTTKSENKGLPSLPFEAMPPSPPDHRESTFRTPSSIYSQYMPQPLNTTVPRDSYATVTTTYTEDISPPSSPEVGTMRRYQNANANDDNVSPIDEIPDASRFEVKQPSRLASSSGPQGSSIPVMRREKKRNQVAAAAQNLVNRKDVGASQRPTKDPRWDPYSGEITTSDRGKPQSAKPGQFTPPALRPANRGSNLGYDANISAAPKVQQSFTDRMRKLKIDNNKAEKPGWKGASGRVTLVNPVADNPDIQPLNIPRKENIRRVSPDLSSPVSDEQRDETYRHHNPLMSNPSQERVDQPVHSNVSSPRTDSPDSVIHDPFEIRQSVMVEKTRPASRPESREKAIPRGVTESTIVRNFHSDLAEAFPKEEEEIYVQPPSRFSMTTYASSTAQATPRPSTDTWERQEMPPLPVQPAPAPLPVLARARPAVLGDEPRLPRKAVGSADPVFLSIASSLPARRVSQMSTLSKHLPQSPAEASSNDLISSLQAQVENLRVRRANISKSIRQMTELMPQDRVVVTDQVRRKREEEKKKIEMLREEEAEVVREEHELGLKLHRAYKRRDKEGIYEPTTLWVRRVTG